MNNQRFGSTPPARHVRKGAAQEQTPETPSPKLWKVMHHPRWTEVHPEAKEFFAMGQYKFAISKRKGAPISLIDEIKVGDRIIVEPQTMLRKNGQPRKNPERSKMFRYGTVSSECRLEEDQLDQPEKNPLYGFCVDWDDDFVPADASIKSKPFKTFTRIK